MKFDWLSVEYRLNKNLYTQWVKNEQFSQSWGDIIASAPLRACYRRFLRKDSNHHLLQFWQDVQNFRILTDYARSVDACRLYKKYIGADKPFELPLTPALVVQLDKRLERCQGPTDELAEPVLRSVFNEAQAHIQETLIKHVAPFMASRNFKDVSLYLFLSLCVLICVLCSVARVREWSRT
jgi:hypothetical protein